MKADLRFPRSVSPFIGSMLAILPSLLLSLATMADPADETATGGMQLLVLGSGGPGALGRASSSYVLSIDGTARILVDAGSGSFVRLGEAHVNLDALDVILLTHLHIDHAAEIPGIVKARAVASSRPIHFDVFGPIGRKRHDGIPSFPSTRRFFDLLFGSDGAFAYLKDFSAPVSFSVLNLPRPSSSAYQLATIYKKDGILISAVQGHHGDAPAVVYRVEANGRSVVFSGDIDAQGLPALANIAQGTDLLVFHSVVLDPPGSPSVLYSLHTPPKAIGELAARAHVGRLLLSHLSGAIEQNRGEVAASIAESFHGAVTFATDGLRQSP